LNISDIQHKVGHTPQTKSDESLNLKENIVFQSALVLKNHNQSDENIKSMLKQDFNLDEAKIDKIIQQLNETKGD